ncbi:MAG: threonylcarbamoyl-AMP synthase [Desulfobacterales bacterium]|nr:threonylcarbamoyl-AMP synthase [Desulfobacterales bacterium]
MPPVAIRRIDPVRPDPAVIAEAARIIETGGIVSFPTTCLYGLGADAFNPGAVEKIFRVKQRPPDKPVLILVRDETVVEDLVRGVPPAARRIMKRFWPGRVTLVLEARDAIPRDLTAGTGKIGVRVPRHPAARALVNAARGPVTGTSANISGQPGLSRSPTPDSPIAAGLDLILDAGALEGGKGSTIVDVTGETPRVLREGAASAGKIFAALENP